MTNRDGIRIELGSIMRELEANGFDEVRVEFAPDSHVAGEVIAGVARQGLVAANNAADKTAPDSAWGSFLTASFAGVSVKIGSLWSDGALVRWLDAFAGELRAGGLSGELRATETIRLPDWVRQIAEPMMTAYVALSAPGDAGAAGWAERAARWAAEAGGDAYVSSAGMSQLDTTGDVAAHLAWTLRVASSGSLLYADAQASRAAIVEIERDGQATYQTHDTSATLEDRTGRARAAVLAEAEHAHYAFMAPTPRRAYGWDARGRALPPLRPEVPATALSVDAHLWNRFVPDVHCMQLLTDEHLAKVSDLSRWTVTPVAPGRTLVEAPDLAEWLRTGGPAPSVLDRARADFGRVLVSADDLR
ncbi:hypothetical protein [Streptomyces sp. NBC_00102]|uniref:hypothetical protein n=1 Tax=Streptomyces sp. NBC_00102 TaxID=2975652 RepID=UPI00225A1628|nr:hypothetical protein [Streptomyces sp. NBC_00102]MCX5398377.1 hypothetical protein [Streptomyces sp. NBC_00102]